MYGDYYEWVLRERVSKPVFEGDIYGGDVYVDYLRQLPPFIRYLYSSCIMNADGANKFNAANLSLWPIHITLNKIPPAARLKNVIPIMLWAARGKPDMSAYLEIYVDFMNHLCDRGIQCVIKGEERLLRLFNVITSVDTIARAPMSATKQCNAYHGCDWREHPGLWLEGCVRYFHNVDGYQGRTRESTLAYAEMAMRLGKPYRGVTSASPLLYLYKFFGSSPEYIHFHSFGGVKQILGYISKSLTEAQLEYVDQLIHRIRVPHQCMRLARKLKKISHWKAKEYENFTLYYNLPIFRSLGLSEGVPKHCSLLVSCLHISISSKITSDNIRQLRQMSHEFVKLTEELYSIAAMTSNIH
ncbi:hypothetical protein QAD02_013101 [Eretmocerus hayati]|uniref:Uncharacterized protein n=1 Tax=Eretmocerus hayati TaxID=131215 RepID=A0ACC2P451_9HYME|nr:hypothetical protein QAD02_013101 [Eretmocerus hayati]